MRILFLIVGLAAATLLTPLGATAGDQPSEPQSAQKFVQDFYTWYLQEEKQEHNEDLSDFALKAKPHWFSPTIVQGLKEDAAAAAKTPDEVVGLDFDPFLNAQDVCEPYRTGKVTVVGATYRVEVFGSCPEANSKQPDVIAAVERRDGSWVFVDFIYPGNGDLFSELQALKKEREKTGK
jgi:hypothetical protein